MRRKDTRITRIKFINRSKFVLIVIFYRLEDLVALEVGLAVPVLAGILSKLSRRKAPVSSLLPKKWRASRVAGAWSDAPREKRSSRSGTLTRTIAISPKPIRSWLGEETNPIAIWGPLVLTYARKTRLRAVIWFSKSVNLQGTSWLSWFARIATHDEESLHGRWIIDRQICAISEDWKNGDERGGMRKWRNDERNDSF